MFMFRGTPKCLVVLAVGMWVHADDFFRGGLSKACGD